MRNRILQAALCAGFTGGLLWAGDAKVGDLPAGISPKQLNDQQDIRAILASATNAAVTNGGFNDMCERLTSADRKRFGEYTDQKFAELDGRVEQIRKNWQTKYGQSLNLDSDKLFEGFVVISEGEVTDATAAKTHWPVQVTRMSSSDPAAANTTASAEYLENGRNVAIVSIPASHGMQAMFVSMLHEPVDDWRIDIPDNITGPTVYNNVKDFLTKFGDNVASWPADVNEAYRHLGHGVLAAMYNSPTENSIRAADAAR